MNLITRDIIDARHEVLAKMSGDKSSAKALELMLGSVRNNCKILTFGNGGSATQASHFAAELVNRFAYDRPSIPALALNVDPGIMTSVSNDYSFKDVFSKQIQGLGMKGDTAVGFTTSGRSENVVRALEYASERGLYTIGVCGNNSEALEAVNCSCIVSVPSPQTPLIQEVHLFLIHLWAGAIESDLYPEQERGSGGQ